MACCLLQDFGNMSSVQKAKHNKRKCFNINKLILLDSNSFKYSMFATNRAKYSDNQKHKEFIVVCKPLQVLAIQYTCSVIGQTACVHSDSDTVLCPMAWLTLQRSERSLYRNCNFTPTYHPCNWSDLRESMVLIRNHLH